MDLESYLAQVDQVFTQAGENCDYGCDEASASDMIAHIKEHLPSYQYCSVADWVWLDIKLEPKNQALFDKRGAKPCFIYAHKVIEDQAQRSFKSVLSTN